MSRCFPYPPLGYEKKAKNDARSNYVYLVAKEKHKERNNKMENRDTEKREGKIGRDKDRRKDKHKEKKNRREKHKDKKKEENRDKGGHGTYNDRIEKPIHCHHKDRLEGSWKTEDIKHYKFTELYCQIKNEEKVEANGMDGNLTSLVQRSFDGSGAKAAKLMERVASIRVISASMDYLPWRINGMDRPADILPSLIQSDTEASGSANTVKKERNTTNLVSDFIYLGQRGNGGNEQPVESRVSLQQRSDGPYITTAVKKENCKRNKVVVPISMVQRSSNGMRQSTESSTIMAHRKVDAIGLAKTQEDSGEIKKLVPSNIFIEQREQGGIGQRIETVEDKSIEGKENKMEGEACGRNDPSCMSSGQDKKNKDKLKEKGKEKAKVSKKCEQKNKEYDEIRDIGKKDWTSISNLELLASQRDKRSTNTDENKKRKEREMNGLLHENDMLPDKFQRTTPTHTENGRLVDSSHVSCSSMKPEAINNIMAGKLSVCNEKHILNGVDMPPPSSDELRYPAVIDNSKGRVSLKPHRDFKYANEIYSVPNMDDLPEYDDQEWLYCSFHLQSKPKTELEADETPQVWAEAIRIGSESVLALPYVIPF